MSFPYLAIVMDKILSMNKTFQCKGHQIYSKMILECVWSPVHLSLMEAILATTFKRYSWKFSKLNWEKLAQKHSLKPHKMELQSATWSDYKDDK